MKYNKYNKVFNKIFNECSVCFLKHSKNKLNTEINRNVLRIEITTILEMHICSYAVYNYFLKLDMENNKGKFINNFDLYLEIEKGKGVVGKSYSNLNILRNKKINKILKK